MLGFKELSNVDNKVHVKNRDQMFTLLTVFVPEKFISTIILLFERVLIVAHQSKNAIKVR